MVIKAQPQRGKKVDIIKLKTFVMVKGHDQEKKKHNS
jgi:hypothetical protein